MAFEVLKTGNVGVAGSTGTVLHRSLMASRALITRSLAEVRLTQGVQNRKQFLVSGFIEEIAAAATLDANARGVNLIMAPVAEDGVAIEADRQVLARWWATSCRTPSSSSGPELPSRSGSAQAPSACSSRSRTSAEGSQVGMLTSSSGRSSSEAPIEPAWVLVSPSADGALKPMAAGSARAICLIGDAFSRSMCRGSRFPPSMWFRPEVQPQEPFKRRTRACAL